MKIHIINLVYRGSALLLARVYPSALPALYRRWGRALARKSVRQ